MPRESIWFLRNAAEVESLIAKMDLVVTTRLHGTVLSLKNGVPVVAIDAIAGGAKVSRQAKTIGWSNVLSIDSLSDEQLEQAFDYCLTAEAKTQAKKCRDRGIRGVEQVRKQFISALDASNQSSQRVWSEAALNKVQSFNRILPNLWKQLVIIRYKITGGIKKWFLRKLYRPQDG